MSKSDFEDTDPHAMSRLLELNTEPQALWKPEELGEILAHQLAMPASVTSFGCATPPTPAHTNLTLSQLLDDPHPSIDMLNNIRRAAKADCSSASALLPRDVALVIYYATIATGLVCLDQRISDLDDTKLWQAFTWTLKRQWLDSRMVSLFERAKKLLEPK